MTDFSIEEDGSYFVGICKYIKPGTENESIGLPLLDIGQMIELLGDDWYYSFFGTNTWVDGACLDVRYEGELCDALWEAVKGDL
jgi:hypothetical protein